MATTMELITARMMIKLFGSFWWITAENHLTTRALSVWKAVCCLGIFRYLYFRFLDGFVSQMAEWFRKVWSEWWH